MASPVGIGCVIVTVAGRIKIRDVNPDGGAAASGNVKAGDFLVALNGVPVTSETHAKNLILGPFVTSLDAELVRDGKTINVTLWRGGAEAKTKGEADAKVKAAAAAKAAAKPKAPKAAAKAKAPADAKAASDVIVEFQLLVVVPSKKQNALLPFWFRSDINKGNKLQLPAGSTIKDLKREVYSLDSKFICDKMRDLVTPVSVTVVRNGKPCEPPLTDSDCCESCDDDGNKISYNVVYVPLLCLILPISITRFLTRAHSFL